MTLLAMDQQYI